MKRHRSSNYLQGDGKSSCELMQRICSKHSLKTVQKETYSNYTRKIGKGLILNWSGTFQERPACMFYYEECTQTIATTIIMY
jgi:hypothetical protein